ncbi:MAG: hypothetical protein KC466_19360 [Myxococcales bacterium]|nr:hypothetical protein [Myxococcales bacterium]
MRLLDTAERAIKAYGGADRWRRAEAIELRVSAGGLAFRMKAQPAFRAMAVRIEIAEPRVRLAPPGWGGVVGVLDGRSCRLEGPDGGVIARREDPRAKFPHGRRLLWWDRLDQTYFSGYALWNYVTFPRLLLREDIAWREERVGLLEATFPDHLPTHSAVQRFHFDPLSGLLLQHDYTAEVFGGWAKAANVVLQHGAADGVPYPSRRRVTPRRRSGAPAPFPTLVWIELDDLKFL